LFVTETHIKVLYPVVMKGVKTLSCIEQVEEHACTTGISKKFNLAEL
jgi:hypothetical protein